MNKFTAGIRQLKQAKLASGLVAVLLLSACASTGQTVSTLSYEAESRQATRQTVCHIWGNADDASYCAPAAARTEVSRRN